MPGPTLTPVHPDDDTAADGDDGAPFGGDELVIPGRWGRAWVLAPITSGGTGESFLATLDDDDEVVVVKRQLPSMALDIGDVLQSAKRLHDEPVDGVVDVVAFGVHAGFGWVASRYYAGIDAQGLMDHAHAAGAHLPLEVALAIVRQGLVALGALHRSGLVHRDISPGNLLVGRDGSVRVVDVDFVVEAGTAATDAVPGTVSCMSPEQAQGLPVDGRADIYGLGIVAYELVVGDTYYGDLPLTDIWSLARTGGYRPRRFDDVPAWLVPVLQSMLAPDASKRAAAAAVVVSDLDAAAAAAGISIADVDAVAAVVDAAAGARLDALDKSARTNLAARVPVDDAQALAASSSPSVAKNKRASSAAAAALLRATVELKGRQKTQVPDDDKSASVFRPTSADSALGVVVAVAVIVVLIAVVVFFDPLGR